MVRFHSNKRNPPRNYTTRREQFRLFALFVPLALVILLMGRLRDPKVAGAINQFFSPVAAAQPQPSEPKPVVKGAKSPSPQLFPGIMEQQLKTIEDNTYFRNAEKDAWFQFLEQVREQPIDPAMAVAVDYVQLVDQPDIYRGKAVLVQGTVREITEEKPAPNDLQIERYYRAIIQPADGTEWPIIVYCLELPPGVSAGSNLSIAVDVVGLFFKRLSYNFRSQEGLGIAPVIIARTLLTTPTETKTRETSQTVDDKSSKPEVPVVTDEVPTQSTSDMPEEAANSKEAFERILSLSDWDNERFAKLEDGQPLSDAQRLEILGLLQRLRSLSTNNLERWSTPPPPEFKLENVEIIRGQLQRLSGRITNVTVHQLSPADAERLEMPAYYECELQCEELPGPVRIFTARIPNEWLRGYRDGVARADAIFIKRLPGDDPRPTLWVAKEIAWFPPYVQGSPDPLLGKSLLGAESVDVGALDAVVPRGRIRPQERELFYKMLRAVGDMPAAVLVHTARQQLPTVLNQWAKVASSSMEKAEQNLAREVVRRANQNNYSVAMLFNDPKPQIGRLFVFDGIARRALRVEVANTAGQGGVTDVASRYGFDYYYELEVFTDDSQSHPIIFCVRELPADFPIGSNIDVPVRVAGFFFKNWLYNARGRSELNSPNADSPTGPQAKFAPLLIGREPIVLPTVPPVDFGGRIVLGGVLLLSLLGITAAAIWFARDERRFRLRTSAANFVIEPGQSLDELNIPSIEKPMSMEEQAAEDDRPIA